MSQIAELPLSHLHPQQRARVIHQAESAAAAQPSDYACFFTSAGTSLGQVLATVLKPSDGYRPGAGFSHISSSSDEMHVASWRGISPTEFTASLGAPDGRSPFCAIRSIASSWPITIAGGLRIIPC